MDLLRSAIAAKQKEVQAAKLEILGEETKKKKVYIRRGQVEEIQLKHLKEEEEKEKERKRKSLQKDDEREIVTKDDQDEQGSSTKKGKVEKESTRVDHATQKVVKKEELKKEGSTMTVEQVKMRLRSYGQPILLFGESLQDQIDRLHRVQQESASSNSALAVEGGHGVRNWFLERDEGKKKKETSQAPSLIRSDSKDDIDAGDDENEEDQRGSGSSLIVTDEKRVYLFFRKMLKMWEGELSNRPETIKFSAQGRLATKTMKQCKDYIRPLFKQCKRREIPREILSKLVDIVKACENNDFVAANDAYIGVAIGNAAWPIGVTMVGIHERTGREKINSQKQAHVMNNEVQRKYLTSVKRLITYCQSISNALPSQKVT